MYSDMLHVTKIKYKSVHLHADSWPSLASSTEHVELDVYGKSQFNTSAIRVGCTAVDTNMAKPVETVKNNSLKELQREIMCPLCLEFFQDSQILPCQHIYCKSCLDRLASRTGNASLSCPECHKEVVLAEGDVANLPIAFPINCPKELIANLPIAFPINCPKELVAKLDVEGESAEADGPSVVSNSSQLPLHEAQVDTDTPKACGRHPGKSLELYCHHCEEVVCSDCLLFDKKHSSHQYDKIEVVASGYRADVKTQLASLLQKEHTISEMVEDTETAHRDMLENCNVITAIVAKSYDRVVTQVETLKAKSLGQ